jgi:hypothetical protein
MAQAASRPAKKQAPESAPAQFTFTLGVTEAQALLAIVGLTVGQTLDPLYQSLEDFHEAHGIERKEVSERHDMRGFDMDRLVDWWTAEELWAA